MVDIDRFASFNNTHGHLIGDEVLREIGSLLSKRIRGKGKAYRYGGDELTVILPNFSSNEAAALAEELRRSIERVSISTLTLSATVSIGVACLPDHANEANALEERAESGCIQRKELRTQASSSEW